MKKYLLSILFCACSAVLVQADEASKPIELDLKVVKLVLPFQEVYTPYLYDIVNKQSLGGIETPFAKSGKVRFMLGAADVEGPQTAMPYVGLDVEVSKKYLGEAVNIGGWFAYDFETTRNRGGVKASIQLW